jgi:hypothetical protein
VVVEAWSGWCLYSSGRAYTLLTCTEVPDEVATPTLIWHKQIPAKASVLVWWLLRNIWWGVTLLRLVRTSVWLDARCGDNTTYVSFLPCFCSYVGPDSVLGWYFFGWSVIDSWSFYAVFFFDGGSQARRSFLQLLWLCSICVVWHERNSRIFKAKESTVLQMLEKVKVHSLWWMKSCNMNLGLNFYVWWSNFFVCLEIDWLTIWLL